MLSVGYFFRGNYASVNSGRALLGRLCHIAELVPEKWGIVEPLNRPFALEQTAIAFNAPRSHNISWIIFLVKKSKPGYFGGVSISRSNYHNEVFFQFNQAFEELEKIVEYVQTGLAPAHPDYGYLADVKQADVDRFAEAYLPRPAAEVFGPNPPVRPPFFAKRSRSGERMWFFNPLSAEMRGPSGWLWDVVWYNLFGKTYVDFIGRDRLVSAGWARVEAVGEGFACYATERIDDPDSRIKRDRIIGNLEEFFWTPGCKREEKRAPLFDFGEQLAISDLGQFAQAPKPTGNRVIQFAGLTPEEEQQAIRKIEQETGMTFDSSSGILGSKGGKSREGSRADPRP